MSTKIDPSLPYVTDKDKKPLSDTIKQGVCVTKLHKVEDALDSINIIEQYSKYFNSHSDLKKEFKILKDTIEDLGSSRKQEILRIAKKFRMIGRINEGNTETNKIKAYILRIGYAFLGKTWKEQ